MQLEQIDNHVFAWPGSVDRMIHVIQRQEVISSFVGVPDEAVDALLDHIAGGVVLGEREDPYDLTVIRGGSVLGVVHRRPGQVSTVTRP